MENSSLAFSTPLSILDLAPIVEGSTAREALDHSRDLAQHAERLGYARFWLAEHHNMPGIASAATSLAIQHVASGTERIRVGAGGVMLPNHSPLVIAEQFGTLATLFPGRIDLGVGRAPGTDGRTAHALRRNLAGSSDDFPNDVLELMHYFEPAQKGQAVRAVPGEGLSVPVWVLGSSLFGASLAAALGLPYAFASHFAPRHMTQAVALYRERFKPRTPGDAPRVMLALNVIAADTDEEAHFLRTSQLQTFVRMRFGTPGKLPPPIAGYEQGLASHERALVDEMLSCTVVGSKATVRQGLADFVRDTGADELILTGMIFDHKARVRSYELVMEAKEELERE